MSGVVGSSATYLPFLFLALTVSISSLRGLGSSAELPNPLKEEMKTVRARNKKGQYVADDPSTPNINEAYTKVPKKRGRPRKKK